MPGPTAFRLDRAVSEELLKLVHQDDEPFGPCWLAQS
jgi:hypothetical protein